MQMIYETVRDFLLRPNVDEQLLINKEQGHIVFCTLLLKYISTSVLKSRVTEKQSAIGGSVGLGKFAARSQPLEPSMVNYACRFFSNHVFLSTSSDDYLTDALCEFLRSNTVLEWIEHVSAAGDLAVIAQTATNLREYIGRRMTDGPSANPTIQLVDGWVIDPIRVAAKFRPQLLTSLSSIYLLAPPMCPFGSFIARKICKKSGHQRAPRGLTVQGVLPGTWDDCLTQIDFRSGPATTVTHGERYFAVGLATGQLLLYDPESLHCLRYLSHPERARKLAFSLDDALLASCGAKHLVIYDPKSGSMRHTISTMSPPLAMIFLGIEEIVLTHQSSVLTKWCVTERPISPMCAYR